MFIEVSLYAFALIHNFVINSRISPENEGIDIFSVYRYFDKHIKTLLLDY